MQRKHLIMIGAGILTLFVFGAGAAAMMNSDESQNGTMQSERIHWSQTASNTQPAPAPQPACDDDNIVGKVAGGVAGGLAGSQVGSGNGKTAATIGGAVGDSLLGEEYLPTKNVTCR